MPLDSPPGVTTSSPKLPIAAAIVAFLLAAVALLSTIQQMVLAVFALFPLLAGVGILRKRVWSAYGFALFALGQLAVVPLILLHTGGSLTKGPVAFTVISNIALALLFFLAGRSLARSGARRGYAAPWILITCLFTLPFIFVEAFIVPSAGMENTLLVGDRIVARVFPRVSPGRGDIVVFRYPIDRRQTFIKRVIGVPGDRIRIVSNTVYRNGVALAEPYVVHKFSSAPDPYRDNFPADPAKMVVQPGSGEVRAIRGLLQHHVVSGEAVVPAGNYFVLGDNRDNSLDSRYWGFLDASDIVGKPVLIYDSLEPPADPGIANNVFNYRRRWNRLFKFL